MKTKKKLKRKQIHLQSANPGDLFFNLKAITDWLCLQIQHEPQVTD